MCVDLGWVADNSQADIIQTQGEAASIFEGKATPPLFINKKMCLGCVLGVDTYFLSC